MGLKFMKKLRIGYWPLSSTLEAAGDRRRMVFWAKARGHTIVKDLSEKVDVIVATERADFGSKFLRETNVPVVFDLVDAYLSPSSQIDDLSRGIAKVTSRQITGGLKKFSEHVRDFCILADAVICSSAEQEVIIKQFQKNTHVILDSHEEIPFLSPQKRSAQFNQTKQIFWEGQPATIRGVQQISLVLETIAKSNSISFEFVTDEKYFLYLNRFFQHDTHKLLTRDLGNVKARISVIKWSIENLVNSAKKSSVSMIPIDLSVPMQKLKPENRLLIMWRLGLPCITSASPAYSRVASSAGVDVTSTQIEDWVARFDRILNDPDYAFEQVSLGQDYVRENHNSTILLNKWDSAIESVIG